MKGKDYKGLKKNKDNKFVLSENKSARKMGPRCDSTFCKKNVVKRKCFTIKDDDRKQLFKSFWDNMTWCERRMWQLYVRYTLLKLIKQEPIFLDGQIQFHIF